jgi:hypothetical protein
MASTNLIDTLNNYFISVTHLQTTFEEHGILFIDCASLNKDEIKHELNQLAGTQKILLTTNLDIDFQDKKIISKFNTISIYNKGKKYTFKSGLKHLRTLINEMYSILKDHLKPKIQRRYISFDTEFKYKMNELMIIHADRMFESITIPYLKVELQKVGLILKPTKINNMQEHEIFVKKLSKLSHEETKMNIHFLYGKLNYMFQREHLAHNGLMISIIPLGDCLIPISQIEDGSKKINEIIEKHQKACEKKKKTINATTKIVELEPIEKKDESQTTRNDIQIVNLIPVSSSVPDMLSSIPPESQQKECAGCSKCISLCGIYFKISKSSTLCCYFHKKCFNMIKESKPDYEDDILNISVMERGKVIKILYERTNPMTSNTNEVFLVDESENEIIKEVNNPSSDHSDYKLFTNDVCENQNTIDVNLYNQITDKILSKYQKKELSRKLKKLVDHQYEKQMIIKRNLQIESKPIFTDPVDLMKNTNVIELVKEDKEMNQLKNLNKLQRKKHNNSSEKQCKLSLDVFQSIFEQSE